MSTRPIFHLDVKNYACKLLVVQELLHHFRSGLRRLAPGPGNWVMDKDLVNLTKFGFVSEFPHPLWMPMAAKLRVTTFAITNALAMHKELMELQLDHPQRPFGGWHSNSFVSVLHRNHSRLQEVKITPRAIMMQLPSKSCLTSCHRCYN